MKKVEIFGITLFLLIILSLAVYIYSNHKKPNTEIQTPLQVYLDFKYKMDKVNTFSEYLEIDSEYATKAQSDAIKIRFTHNESFSKEEGDIWIKKIKDSEPLYQEVLNTNFSQAIYNNTALLATRIRNNTVGGIITMKNENGSWKVYKEAWMNLSNQ